MNTNKKTHKLANKKKFQVTYAFAGGKWNFRIGDFTLMTKVPGGKVNADKIAEILRNSWLRCAKVDGTARNAIERITSRNFKPLKNYRGPFDHNWSWSEDKNQTVSDEPTINMIPPTAPAVESAPTLPVVEMETEPEAVTA